MGLDEQPEFAPAIDLVDTGGDLSAFISNITETFAGLYLANQKNLIAFVHTVTAPARYVHWRHIWRKLMRGWRPYTPGKPAPASTPGTL